MAAVWVSSSPSARMCSTATPCAWERLCHEQGAVTLQRFFFRTHECDAAFGHTLYDPLESSLEGSGFTYLIVADLRLFRRSDNEAQLAFADQCVFGRMT